MQDVIQKDVFPPRNLGRALASKMMTSCCASPFGFPGGLSSFLEENSILLTVTEISRLRLGHCYAFRRACLGQVGHEFLHQG